MRVLIIREALQRIRSGEQGEYYFLLQSLFSHLNPRVTMINAEIGQYLPPDFDLYVAHGILAGEAVGRLPPRKIKDAICISCTRPDAINTPLQKSWYNSRNTGGDPADHFILAKDVAAKIKARGEQIVMNKETPQLFHISFNGKLEGIWQPKHPDGAYTKEQREQLIKDIEDQKNGDFVYDEVNIYTETLDPRICLSDSIQGCFSAIFPNLSKLYYEGAKRNEKMQFFVYYPVDYREADMMTWEELTQNKQVWDAHISREYVLFSATKMVKYPMIVEIPCVKKPEYIMCRPYHDKQYPAERHSPYITHSWRLKNELD